MDRLEELRAKFDRACRSAEENGYCERIKRELKEISVLIRQEEIARRFANGSEKVEEKRSEPI